jgi:hypothetical protein
MGLGSLISPTINRIEGKAKIEQIGEQIGQDANQTSLVSDLPGEHGGFVAADVAKHNRQTAQIVDTCVVNFANHLYAALDRIMKAGWLCHLRLSLRPTFIHSSCIITDVDLQRKSDSVLPCVGEFVAVLVSSCAGVAPRASLPPLLARFWAGATVPWAFTRPKHRDN